MEKAIQILIYIHATFGGIALLTGLISIIAKKGKPIHKKFGLVFFYSMILSGIIAMIVAVLPKHESPFLFVVGVFSLYFVWVHNHANTIDNKTAVLERVKRYLNSNNKNTKSRTSKDVKVIISGTTGVVSGFTIVDRGPTPTTYHLSLIHI